MTVRELHRAIVEAGIDADPRGRAGVDAALAGQRKRWERLSDDDKAFFDEESLWNPFADSRILAGDPDREVRRVMVGIDIDTSELLLVDRLNERGAGIDLVIAHHPSAHALATLDKVMGMQSDIFYAQGISMSVSEQLMGPRVKQVERSVASGNFLKTAMAAEQLGIALMCAHTPADSMGMRYLEAKIAEEKPETLGAVVSMLKSIPEYAAYAKKLCPPRIIAGAPENRVRKVHFEFTGGTEGPSEIYDQLAAAGVDTVVCMHQSDKHLEAAGKAKLNVVLAGHIASDNLGLNLLFDNVTKGTQIEIRACSGFVRTVR